MVDEVNTTEDENVPALLSAAQRVSGSYRKDTDPEQLVSERKRIHVGGDIPETKISKNKRNVDEEIVDIEYIEIDPIESGGSNNNNTPNTPPEKPINNKNRKIDEFDPSDISSYTDLSDEGTVTGAIKKGINKTADEIKAGFKERKARRDLIKQTENEAYTTKKQSEDKRKLEADLEKAREKGLYKATTTPLERVGDKVTAGGQYAADKLGKGADALGKGLGAVGNGVALTAKGISNVGVAIASDPNVQRIAKANENSLISMQKRANDAKMGVREAGRPRQGLGQSLNPKAMGGGMFGSSGHPINAGRPGFGSSGKFGGMFGGGGHPINAGRPGVGGGGGRFGGMFGGGGSHPITAGRGGGFGNSGRFGGFGGSGFGGLGGGFGRSSFGSSGFGGVNTRLGGFGGSGSSGFGGSSINSQNNPAGAFQRRGGNPIGGRREGNPLGSVTRQGNPLGDSRRQGNPLGETRRQGSPLGEKRQQAVPGAITQQMMQTAYNEAQSADVGESTYDRDQNYRNKKKWKKSWK